MPKIIIATGGTGGHLFPSQQLAEKLKECEVVFVGHKLGSSPFFDHKFPYVEIDSSSSKKGLKKLMRGFVQSFRFIRSFQPDVVVGFGSFHTFPVLLAAFLLRRKIVLFEPNASLGKVNSWFSFSAEKIAFQFPVEHRKAAYVPLLPWKDLPLNKAKISKKKRTILVFGGSQGALFINEIVPKAVSLLSFDVNMIHLTGKQKMDLTYPGESTVKEFEEDMPSLYAKADFVICRAGASTIAELIRYRLPAILIPYPHAYAHQKKNAEILKSAAKVLDQKGLTEKMLAEEIEDLHAYLEHYEKAFDEIPSFQTEEFSSIVMEIAGRI